MIEVKKLGVGTFEVRVRDEEGETLHRVTMSADAYRRLAAGHVDEEHVLEAAFRFLLDREPKESILQRFDVSVIARYFPEFERVLPSYFRGPP
jgi:hypothetical protein